MQLPFGGADGEVVIRLTGFRSHSASSGPMAGCSMEQFHAAGLCIKQEQAGCGPMSAHMSMQIPAGLASPMPGVPMQGEWQFPAAGPMPAAAEDGELNRQASYTFFASTGTAGYVVNCHWAFNGSHQSFR